jgi:hypothetical protein
VTGKNFAFFQKILTTYMLRKIGSKYGKIFSAKFFSKSFFGFGFWTFLKMSKMDFPKKVSKILTFRPYASALFFL